MAPRSQPFPGDHPAPTERLQRRALPLVEQTGPWFRIHHVDRGPLHVGVSRNNRFDDPLREYGVLYAGTDAHCAFIETFGQLSGFVDITHAALEKRRLCRITADRALRLVDLSSSGLARIGADGRVTTGNHDTSQQWSRAFWTHPAAPDGLAYRARHDQSRVCVALFSRADLTFADESLGTLLDDRLHDVLDELLDMYGFGLA